MSADWDGKLIIPSNVPFIVSPLLGGCAYPSGFPGYFRLLVGVFVHLWIPGIGDIWSLPYWGIVQLFMSQW